VGRPVAGEDVFAMTTRSIIALGIALVATASVVSTARADWGCLAENRNGVWGRSWSMSDEDGAKREALAGCNENRRRGESACRIIECSSRINTHEDAKDRWPKENCKTNCE
jgi:hypothetical protein